MASSALTHGTAHESKCPCPAVNGFSSQRILLLKRRMPPKPAKPTLSKAQLAGAGTGLGVVPGGTLVMPVTSNVTGSPSMVSTQQP